jgi:hypothetical protein
VEETLLLRRKPEAASADGGPAPTPQPAVALESH